MSGGAHQIWERLLERIAPQVGAHHFTTWFKPTRLLSDDGSRLVVHVPNDWYVEWLGNNYLGLILELLAANGTPRQSVRFEPPVAAPAPPAVGPARAAAPAATPCSSLNPRYTFESFVVSSCNQFAQATAHAVAEQPMRAYNPLYIYGGVGLGKTHLMQAIGNRLAGRGGLRLCYMSAEHFMNEMINAIKCEKTLEFKNRFRNVDVLLIDDVQFVAGRERTQEELFHTFNALYDAHKQIVITSDLPPRQLPTIEDRLRSRFEWGMIADIQPPDLETRLAILRRKAEAERVALPEDVALLIASRCVSNIRELEGALVRVIACGSITGEPVSLEMAREHLKDFGTAPASSGVTAEGIQKVVANHYRMRVGDLKSRTNRPQVALPRQVAMYLCRELTPISLPEIGRRFGGKHHTTVIHSVRKVERLRRTDRDFDALIQNLAAALR